MENILEAKNIQVSFNTYAGEVKAVRGVGFELKPGETLAFVGESGCGKTVTSKALLRLLQPPFAVIKEGSSVLFNGEEVMTMSKKRLREYRGGEVSMIFQDPMTSLNPTMTCGKQIMEALMLHKHIKKKDAKAEAIEMLRMVKIPDPEKRFKEFPHQMSGGMRQRVMIAIALSCQPKVLIADEPTTALDVTIQAQIFELLTELRNKMNIAIILITHDLGVVANFADRIQVMYAGQVIERGNSRDIFYDPKHPYTVALLNSVPKVSGDSKAKLYSLGGTPPDLLLPLECCPFAARCEFCMPICRKQAPLERPVSETHSAACWLMHPDAPKFDLQSMVRK